MKQLVVVLILIAIPAPASAQFDKLKGVLNKAAKVYDDYTFTNEEERQIGSDISGKLREKYGVVQDRAVHKYVALVGSVVAAGSTRPNLPWTFIVLDTDGVNAFAAPGGFIHVTRGALALIQNEGELADVLGHEIGHVTGKHTLNAIQKAKIKSAGAAATRQAFLQAVANQAYDAVLENGFDRDDEIAADKVGLIVANKSGYIPTGLAAFLTRLADRNKGLKERSGLFASHPETSARIEALGRTVSAEKLTATATVVARYRSAITFKPVAVTQVEQVAPPASSSGSTAAPSSSGGGKYGISGLNPLAKQKSSDATVASAGSRGVNPDRDAKGGPNRALVVVTVSAAELAQFRTGISG